MDESAGILLKSLRELDLSARISTDIDKKPSKQTMKRVEHEQSEIAASIDGIIDQTKQVS